MSRGSLTSVHRLPTMRAARFFWSPAQGKGNGFQESLSLCVVLHRLELGAQAANDAGRPLLLISWGEGKGSARRDQCIGRTNSRGLLSEGGPQSGLHAYPCANKSLSKNTESL